MSGYKIEGDKLILDSDIAYDSQDFPAITAYVKPVPFVSDFGNHYDTTIRVGSKIIRKLQIRSTNGKAIGIKSIFNAQLNNTSIMAFCDNKDSGFVKIVSEIQVAIEKAVRQLPKDKNGNTITYTQDWDFNDAKFKKKNEKRIEKRKAPLPENYGALFAKIPVVSKDYVVIPIMTNINGKAFPVCDQVALTKQDITAYSNKFKAVNSKRKMPIDYFKIVYRKSEKDMLEMQEEDLRQYGAIFTQETFEAAMNSYDATLIMYKFGNLFSAEGKPSSWKIECEGLIVCDKVDSAEEAQNDMDAYCGTIEAQMAEKQQNDELAESTGDPDFGNC
jgi:hypothetical protein